MVDQVIRTNLDLNSNIVKGLGNATASGEAVHYGQVGALGFKATIDSASLIDNSVITEAKLSSAVQTKLNANTAQNKTDATADPTVNNDTSEGYSVGSFWLNQTSGEAFRCFDATDGAADWQKTTLTIDELGALAVKNTIDSASLLDDSVVSYAKIQDVSATNKILGRSTVGAGVIEEIDCTAFARSILDDADEATFKATVNLEIGTDVQAQNARLTDISGLGVTDGGIIVGDGSNFVLETGATARASLGLTIGTDVLAQADVLDDIAALAVTDGNIIVGNGSTFVAESGATARTSLGLGSAAVAALIDDDTFGTASSSNIPSAESVKAYVDANAGGATYDATFVSGDFASGVLTIARDTHGAGTDVSIIVQEDDGTNYVEANNVAKVYSVKANGDVKVEVNSGNEFNGRIKITAI